jgi:hypothetical protein
MIKPDAHLRKLIIKATPEQQRLAVAIAGKHLEICKMMGIEPAPLSRVLAEALEMELHLESAADKAARKNEFFTRRTYTRTYTEQ